MGGKTKVRICVGDVSEIPLPNGKFAYGRVYDDAGVGIYTEISDVPDSPPLGSREFLFNVGVYEDILKSGRWRIVGHDPFEDNESPFPPPSYIEDVISGECSIYHKGEIRRASRAECRGLEETAVWDSHHIIDRIMNAL